MDGGCQMVLVGLVCGSASAVGIPKSRPQGRQFPPRTPDTSSSTSYGVQPLSPHQPPQAIVLL